MTVKPTGPAEDRYVQQCIMHPIEDLERFGLAHRVTLPLRRYGYDYIEDLLGTKPWGTTVAHGCEPPVGISAKAYWRYTYHESWLAIPRISEVAIEQMLTALTAWKEMNRRRKGKPLADTPRVPI